MTDTQGRHPFFSMTADEQGAYLATILDPTALRAAFARSADTEVGVAQDSDACPLATRIKLDLGWAPEPWVFDVRVDYGAIQITTRDRRHHLPLTPVLRDFVTHVDVRPSGTPVTGRSATRILTNALKRNAA